MNSVVMGWCGRLGALSAALAAPGAAFAFEAGVLEGRWKTDARGLVIDISRCGEQYCGQLVRSQNQCGATILTLRMKSRAEDGELMFEGSLALPGVVRRYSARLSVAKAADGALPLVTLTGIDPKASFASRNIPFEAVLARIGTVSCRQGVSS